MNAKSGIYSITNMANGHRYVGSAINLAKRWGAHCSLLQRAVHDNRHLQRAFDKYGKATFRFEVLEECEIRQLIEREQWWLDASQPEYNICKVAGSSLGVRHTAEFRAKCSAIQKTLMTPERRARMSAALKGTPSPNKGKFGRKHTAGELAKMASSMRGKKASLESRQKQSAAQMGHVAWNKGQKTPVDIRRKISMAKMGHQVTAEARAKISASHKGKPWTGAERLAHTPRLVTDNAEGL